MALPVRKGYNGAPAQAVLTNNPGGTEADTTFIVDTVTKWGAVPFYCVVEPGTSREEKVKVTAISTLTLTVVRGADNTNIVAHSAGASIYPVFTAVEADEANQIASVMTTKGDLISTNGSAINRLGIGTNTHVLQADSTATNGFKWGQIVEAGIADSAVTSAKIAAETIVNNDISAVANIALSKLDTGALPTGITVASANIVNLSIVDEDINGTANIALSKLATGALPTGITVASANIVNGTITGSDISTSSDVTINSLIVNGNTDLNYTVGVSGTGIAYYGSLYGGGTPNAIGFRWANPDIVGVVDNVLSCVVGSVSDRRVKDEIQDWSDGLNIVKQLNTKSFKTKNFAVEEDGTLSFDSELSEETCFGLIADEVEQTATWLVTGEATNKTLQSVDYAKIVVPLISAVQQLNKKIEDLETKLASLESK